MILSGEMMFEEVFGGAATGAGLSLRRLTAKFRYRHYLCLPWELWALVIRVVPTSWACSSLLIPSQGEKTVCVVLKCGKTK